MGHNPNDVWEYTPRRIAAFLRFAFKRVSRKNANDLSIQTLAARGDPKDVKKQLRDLTRE